MVEIAESIQLGIDTLNGLDWYFQVLICIATSILAIYCLRRFVLRQIAELVNDTEVGWDNDLYIALGQSRSAEFDFPSAEFSLHLAIYNDVNDHGQDCYTSTDGADEQQQERRCFGYRRQSLREYHCSNCDLADWNQCHSG